MNKETRMYSLNLTDGHGIRHIVQVVGLESITKVTHAPEIKGL